LAALIAPIANGSSVSVGHSFPSKTSWVTLEERMWHVYTYQILKLSWIQGDRSIAIRRDLLERIGGLPEHTYAREDWDIWARLEPLGERVVFAEAARLVTDRPSTLKESWVHQVRWRRTHLAGMWEQRLTLIKQPMNLFRQMYGYVQSVAVFLLIFIALIATLFLPGWRSLLWNLLALVFVWICFRQAAVAFAVAAYTKEWVWLGRAWMPALNILFLIPASIVALLTHHRLNPYYKGPRYRE
jgi:cellulose synthase/poly-beta-1,6-N-acetylglucosamine synthase-like glycosyltransferase